MNTENKHTPGPWTIDRRVKTGLWNENAVKIIADSLVIATMQNYVPAKGEEKEIEEMCTANARLIQAAPEMFQSLTNVYDAIGRIWDQEPELLKRLGIPDEMIVEMEGALARARTS